MFQEFPTLSAGAQPVVEMRCRGAMFFHLGMFISIHFWLTDLHVEATFWGTSTIFFRFWLGPFSRNGLHAFTSAVSESLLSPDVNETFPSLVRKKIQTTSRNTCGHWKIKHSTQASNVGHVYLDEFFQRADLNNLNHWQQLRLGFITPATHMWATFESLMTFHFTDWWIEILD